MSIVTLATDFGDTDGYNGAVIGSIMTMNPGAQVVEITNSLTSIDKAAVVLFRYHKSYPKGTVHLVIIDPMVGSDRLPIIGNADGQYFIGPDNGVFSWIINCSKSSNWHVIDINKLPSGEISATFHGRDIFGPAAGLISKNGQFKEVAGGAIEPVVFEIPRPIITQEKIAGEIIEVDKFGNLVTNIDAAVLTGHTDLMKIRLNNVGDIPFRRTFSEVPAQAPVAYIGSLGFLEIAINLERADEIMNANIGSMVEVIL